MDSFRDEKQKQNDCCSPKNDQVRFTMALGDRRRGPAGIPIIANIATECHT